MPTDDAVFETHLPLRGRRQGKVREVYDLAPDAQGPRLLLVASDRVSAFDVVMPTAIPGKGRLLTAIASGWFEFLRGQSLVKDHLLSTDVEQISGIDEPTRAALRGRSMICRAAQVVPIECVARGYLAGSGWNEYQASATVCGVKLPAGLRQCERLPEPIFTPATKAAHGHDENVSFEQASASVGQSLMARLREITLRTYTVAAAHALERGVILADTKFEFGFALDRSGSPTEELILVDEVLTPDSSRYWPVAGYAPGGDQPSFDKQFLRNWLVTLVESGAWDKNAPGPEVPAEIVSGTRARYEEAYERLFAK
ncbi:MAG: phosphoribosylaminoimidazolesuccinocarboxamide synthase [Phycisphaerales bacterium]|nr:phosphoribosylaminoimidazolesuccinocarboxamide synthase [Phycisphaerales bacterium]